MANDKKKAAQPIVIKRIKKVAGGHHGGAWKIAYADFVTAMMAFFLLMWLLGSTAKGDLNGIAEYFKTPLKVAMQGGSGAGDATSVIQGGGKDLTRRDGQVKNGQIEAKKKKADLKAARAELARQELAKLTDLKKKIEAAIDASPTLSQFKQQLLLDITSEGLRIQIVDEQNRPMFAIGSAQLQSYTKDILHELSSMLNEVDNKIALTGHTDATPYSGGERGYSNWELSSDRANASRRELVIAGVVEQKILRVIGLSSSVLFDQKDPHNPMNRRISIIVMNKQTEEALSKDTLTARSGSKEDDADADETTPGGAAEPSGAAPR
jgi:chemotaxis protein MotB